MEFGDAGNIPLDRFLNRLDKFIPDFVKILERRAKYKIISGRMPKLSGRSRYTGEIDGKKMPKPAFSTKITFKLQERQMNPGTGRN